MTLRIAFVTAEPFTQASGVRVVVESLSRELAALGHEICVFGVISNGSPKEVPDWWRGAKVQTFSERIVKTFGFSNQICARLAQFKPDVIHVHGIWTFSSIAGMQVKRATGASLIISPHGALSAEALKQSTHKKRLAMAFYQHKCLMAADGFHVTCDEEAQEVLSIAPRAHVQVIRNGVDAEANTIRPMTARQKRVLALCRLDPKKGLENLISAWKHMAHHRPDWTLELRGPDRNGYINQLKALAATCTTGQISFGGPLFHAERDAVMADSKLFMLPSKNENFGLTAAEALSVGTPVIAATGTPWSGLIDQSAGWWTDNTPETLARALLHATSLPDSTLEAMGQRGQDWMLRSFRWKDIAADMSGFYTDISRCTAQTKPTAQELCQ